MKIWIKEIDTKLEGILIKKLEQVISTQIEEFKALKPLENAILLNGCESLKIKITVQIINIQSSLKKQEILV